MATLQTEEHELPCIEAVLAGTLALMTGYGQALQAELDPAHRLGMGRKVIENLALLGQHPQLSLGFRQVLLGLHRRWHDMSQCTEQAAEEAASAMSAATGRFVVTGPERLQ
jgi:hypothetical protein